MGSRGIPGNYGGFETCAEELATRLVEKGHRVIVYCCKPYSKFRAKTYKGVKLVTLPTVRQKALEKVVYSSISLLHVSLMQVDIVLMLGVSAAAWCFIPRLVGKKVAINIDGLEWQRKKWDRIISRYLLFAEKMAGVVSNVVITDSKWIKEYYLKRYGKESIFIAYGANCAQYVPGETLKRLGLQPKEYILYVSRFDPENNALLVRKAFDEIRSPSKKLVMVGDAPFATNYIREVRDTENQNVIFTGYLFGDSYHELRCNSFCYIQATEIGGTHPALVEAMAAGKCVLANDVPEHREVLEGAGVYYRGKDDLREKMKMLMRDEVTVKKMGRAAFRRVQEEFLWERIADKYEELFYSLTGVCT